MAVLNGDGASFQLKTFDVVRIRLVGAGVVYISLYA
jgi:hypothetical protein